MRAGRYGLFLQFAVAVKRSYRGLHMLSSMRKTANVVIDSDALLSAGPRKTLLGGNRMRSAMGSGRMWSITGAVILAACLTAVMPSLAHAASITGSNGGNVSIPDNDGWVYSGITISGAPSGAIVTGIDCHFSCIHTWSSDLDIDLKDQGSTRNYHMWSREGGSADNPSRTVSGITIFNGLAVNGTWKLFAKDMAAGDTGYIDEWWITIYYSLPGQINGSKWEDTDGDAYRDPNEHGLPDWKIYLDLNRNGQWDTGEPYQMTDSDGNYAFTGLAPGKYFVAEVSQSDWEQTYPSASGTGVMQFAQAITTTGSKVPIVPYMSGKPTNGGHIAPQLVESGDLIRMDEFRADPRFAGINGGGYAVAILDTGIDVNHPFFGPDSNGDGIADRIVFQHDFADNDNDASDHDGHGSNVSSIAASQDVVYTGMAPAANIVALKVFTDSGNGNFGIVEQALQWVVNNSASYNIVSVNMSLGDGQNYITPEKLYGINDEIAVLASRNIVVSCASGNDFFPFYSQIGVSYPAADPNAFSVGAVYDANTGGWSYGSGAIAYSTGPDRICPFSQRHPTLTSIFAPGAVITGANWDGGTVDMHGTSQAAPHIAGIGVLAQHLSQNVLGRPLTNTEFEIALNASGVVINDGDDEDDNVTNTGLNFRRVDMPALGEAILAGGYPGRHKVSIRSGDVVTGVNFGNRLIPIPTILPVVPTECPVVNTQCPPATTTCPAVPTSCPVAETSCPLVTTQCPVVNTQCPTLTTSCPVVSTICPVVNTQCPADNTRCPVVDTQCPTSSTRCPAVSTICPVVNTQCPADNTRCPEINTQCPPATTQCPVVNTQCPTLTTSCPVVSTICPESPTNCPVVSTSCPPVTTECPPEPTMCPPVMTACPPVLTNCPAPETTCTAVPTVCPPLATACPASDTSCPPIDTHCPPAVTACPPATTSCPPVVTACPPQPTMCPPVMTACPPVLTNCPAPETTCTAVPTVCPPVGTACPPVGTACPPVDTACPPMETWCPLVATACPPVDTTCPSVPTACPPNLLTVCPVSNAQLIVQSTPITSVAITGSPSGTTDYTSIVPICPVTQVSLTAPVSINSYGTDYSFVRWTCNGVPQAIGQLAVTFTMTANTTAVAVYSAVFHLSLKAGGWNLVSLPLDPTDGAPSSVFGPNLLGVYEWNTGGVGGYIVPTTIAAKTGYWVAVNTDTDIDFLENPAPTSTVHVVPGWNLVGPRSDTALPTGGILGVYAWDWPGGVPMYVVPTQCLRGHGYWIAPSVEMDIW